MWLRFASLDSNMAMVSFMGFSVKLIISICLKMSTCLIA